VGSLCGTFELEFESQGSSSPRVHGDGDACLAELDGGALVGGGLLQGQHLVVLVVLLQVSNAAFQLGEAVQRV
jgi:hypothetical protein